jgi:hypothetical protein
MRILARVLYQPWPRIARETHSSGLLAVLANQKEESIHVEKQDGNTAYNLSAMLISAGMTWQQRLLFIGGIAIGVGGDAPESCR